MAKSAATDPGFEKLKSDIASGNIGSLYVFYGEEAYLRDAYFTRIKNALISPEFEELNYTSISGKEFTAEKLSHAIESYPVMSERRLIAVSDFDIMKPASLYTDSLCEILSDLPEYICVIFIYDTLEYKQDKKNPVCAEIYSAGTVVNFKKAGGAELNRWIVKRFAALHKKIDTAECEFMTFYCGNSMLPLISEIEKTAAFCRTDKISKTDIEAVCIKNLDTAIYEMTACISAKQADCALRKLRELLAMDYEPVVLSASLCKQINKLYSAALCLQYGKSKDYFMKLWDMKSAYPAEKLLQAARGLKLNSIRKALIICGKYDLEMKSVSGDRKTMLELMLLQAAQVISD